MKSTASEPGFTKIVEINFKKKTLGHEYSYWQLLLCEELPGILLPHQSQSVSKDGGYPE